jgi:hypothetical protein
MLVVDWIAAGGDNRVPFLAAASRVLDEGFLSRCPACGKKVLRAYFHIFNDRQGTGTLWVWCACCHVTIHLPRVELKKDILRDPFAHLGMEDFAALELAEEGLLDRLDQLWDDGLIG